jgi:hypothetical protein
MPRSRFVRLSMSPLWATVKALARPGTTDARERGSIPMLGISVAVGGLGAGTPLRLEIMNQ